MITLGHLETMRKSLRGLRHCELQCDCTYKCISQVLSNVDWRTVGYEDFLRAQKHCEECSDNGDGDAMEEDASEDDEMDDDEMDDDEKEQPMGALSSVHHKRQRAGALSTSQLIISDEFELVHLAIPCNGVVG